MSTIRLPIYNIVITGDIHKTITSDLTKDLSDDHDDCEMKAAMNAIEAMVLAHHCAGVDVTTKNYLLGIETAVEASEFFTVESEKCEG